MKIITNPDPRLRRVAKKVESINSEVEKAITHMLYIMYKNNGIGIAAPQIGIDMRIIGWDIMYRFGAPKVAQVIINPVIRVPKVDFQKNKEGCLSCPGQRIEIVRHNDITVTGKRRAGHNVSLRVTGTEAAVIQHEVDHLNGRLIIDYENTKKDRGILGLA